VSEKGAFSIREQRESTVATSVIDTIMIDEDILKEEQAKTWK